MHARPCALAAPLLAAALVSAALHAAACGTATPERPARDTCGAGACDAIPAGNAAGTCSPPADAQAEDVSTPTTVFFVSNDRTGSMTIDRSTLRHRPSMGFETAGLPGIFVLASGPPVVTGSTVAP